MNRIIRICIAMAVLSFSLSTPNLAKADFPLIGGSGSISYFDQLVELYGNGTVPRKIDVNGWSAGRCFSREAPFNAENGMLIGFTSIRATNPGPAFEAQPQFFLQTVFSDYYPANYLDGEIEWNDLTSIVSLLRRGLEHNLLPAIPGPDSYISPRHSGDGTGHFDSFYVRKYGAYLIAMYPTDKNPDVADQFCYFWDKKHIDIDPNKEINSELGRGTYDYSPVGGTPMPKAQPAQRTPEPKTRDWIQEREQFNNER